MNTIDEQQIWEYLDGTLSEEKRREVELLLENDPVAKHLYNELLEFNASLRRLDTNAPSMSFTRNVMDQVKTLPTPGSVKSLIDKKIIWGIAAFFILMITSLLGYVFLTVSWSAENTRVQVPFTVLPEEARRAVINGFVFADIVIGLYVLDRLFREKFMPVKGKK